jgi:hypothetical protein
LLGLIENPGFSRDGGATGMSVFICVRVFLSIEEYRSEFEKFSAARFRLAFEALNTCGSFVDAINLPFAERIDCPCEYN